MKKKCKRERDREKKEKERRTEWQKSNRGEKQPAAFVPPSRGSLSKVRAAGL